MKNETGRCAKEKMCSANGNYGIEIEMTLEQAKDCSHPGSCDAIVFDLSECPEIKKQTNNWNAKILAKELRDYGAWNDEELLDDAENIQRMLWIFAGDIAEDWHACPGCGNKERLETVTALKQCQICKIDL